MVHTSRIVLLKNKGSREANQVLAGTVARRGGDAHYAAGFAAAGGSGDLARLYLERLGIKLECDILDATVFEFNISIT